MPDTLTIILTVIMAGAALGLGWIVGADWGYRRGWIMGERSVAKRTRRQIEHTEAWARKQTARVYER